MMRTRRACCAVENIELRGSAPFTPEALHPER